MSSRFINRGRKVSRALDIAYSGRPAHHAIPKNLIVNCDNTAREGKNQFYKTFNDSLVALERFESATVSNLRFGHTHNGQDQKFSILGSVLARAPELEDRKPKDGCANG